jgi:hypothetical protein
VILKYKSYNLINEVYDLDYKSYNTPLNEEEFVHLLKTECSDWDFTRVELSRTIFTKEEVPSMMLVDGSKHELRFPKGRYHNYILLHVIDKSKTWGNMPDKYRSIDFWYSKSSSHTGILSEMNHYMMIPYNKARLANAPVMIGKYMKFVKHVFGMSTTSLCESIERTYEYIFKKKFDFTDPDTTINCLRELNEPIMETDGSLKMIPAYGMLNRVDSIKVLNFLKNKMELHDKKDLPIFLDYCFDPKKNDFKLMSVEECYHPHLAGGGGYQPGWTDSKVLLIKDDEYKKIRAKL